MTHLLFVDMTQGGLAVLKRAVECGYAVTFVRNRSVQWFYPDREYDEALRRCVQVIDVADTSNAEELTPVVSEVHSERYIDGVIGNYDPAQEAIAIACERVGVRFASPEGIANVRDKSRIRGLLSERQLLSTSFAVVRDVREALDVASSTGYPVVVKPVYGMGSIEAHRVDTSSQLAATVGAMLENGSAPEYLLSRKM